MVVEVMLDRNPSPNLIVRERKQFKFYLNNEQ